MPICRSSHAYFAACVFAVKARAQAGMHTYYSSRSEAGATAILIIIEGSETYSIGFQYQFTTGKPLKNLKLTLNYYENGSMLDKIRF
jgi:hypothetical protein